LAKWASIRSKALLAPAGKPLVDRIPFPILSRQEPPGRAATRQPKDAFHKPTTFRLILADVGMRVVVQEISYLCPLVIVESHGCHETSFSLFLNVNTT
jgi:hypothetical protein